MPRKALATARATLRFAHRAADERGVAQHDRRGLHEPVNGACVYRVSASSHVRTLTKNFGSGVDSATSLGVFYNL